MKLSIYILALLLPLGLIFSSCSNNRGSENETQVSEFSETGEGDDHSDEETVHLTTLQVETAGIEIGALESLPLSETIKTNGFLELPPQNQAQVSSILGGIVTDIFVREGEPVSEGDILADMVDPRYSKMQADYRKTVQQISYLEEDYERKQRLSDDAVGSQRELQLARSEYESAMADKLALESQLRMLNLDPERVLEGDLAESVPLKAPFGGYVRVIETKVGQYADPNKTLFEIVDNEHIHIDLFVYEKDIHKVQVGQEVLFKYTNQPNDRFYRARIFSVGKAFEDNPRAVRVHAELEDRQDGLLPGMFIDGRIVIGTTQSMTLPAEAVIRNGDEFLVFALHQANIPGETEEGNANDQEEEEMEFEVVKVRPGITDSGYTEVLFFSSIPEDMRFVTHGAYYLLAEMKKGEGGHDH